MRVPCVFHFTLQFDLVCDRAWLVPVVSSCYQAGYFVVFFVGILGDRFGRKPTLLASMILALVSRVVQIFSPHILVYAVARFIHAAGDISKFSLAFVMGKFYYSILKRGIIQCAIEGFSKQKNPIEDSFHT